MSGSAIYSRPTWILPMLAFGGWLLLPGFFLRAMAIYAMLFLVLLYACLLVAPSQRWRWKMHAVGLLLAVAATLAVGWDLIEAMRASRDLIDTMRERSRCGPTYAELRASDSGWLPLDFGGLKRYPRGPLGTPHFVMYRLLDGGRAYVGAGVLDAGAYGWEFPCVGLNQPPSTSPPPPPRRP